MVHDAPSVDLQPMVSTCFWRTYVIGNDVHLVCVMPDTGRVRTTTPIKSSDLEKQEFVTESGRVYACMGPMSPDCVEFRMALMVNGLISSSEDGSVEASLLQ